MEIELRPRPSCAAQLFCLLVPTLLGACVPSAQLDFTLPERSDYHAALVALVADDGEAYPVLAATAAGHRPGRTTGTTGHLAARAAYSPGDRWRPRHPGAR